jgi:hypothetical protein
VKKAIDGLKGKSGVITIGTNFDHALDFPRPDTKHFDGGKYDAVVKRIAYWAMPLGQMVLERSLNPYLVPVFKMQAAAERELMGAHLMAVFAALNPPKPFKVAWSNRCFTDSRMFTDLLKFGLTSGPLSQETFLSESGYDANQERARKAKEALLPDSQKHPAFDAAHGNSETAGRKAGSPDNP